MTGAKISVKRDDRGVWYCRPYLGLTASGRPYRPRRSFPECRTEAEALEAAREWAAELTSGGRVPSMALTDLLEGYVGVCAAMGASPNSVATYRTYMGYVRRGFRRGARADELTSLDFTAFQRRLLERGGEGGAPLSRTTVSGCYQFLRGAYRYLVAQGVVSENPMLAAAKPGPERREAAALDEYDLRSLAAWIDRALKKDAVPARDRVTAMGCWIALHTGLRAGEVCALRRRDVSAARGWVHVGGTVVEAGGPPRRKEKPKSSRSRRNVSVTPAEVAAIGRFEAWQGRELGVAGGSAFLVSADGEPMRPSALSSAFKRVARSLGLDPRASFHTLRHTHASWLISRGIDLITLSERLGHGSPDVTSKIYGHVVSGRDSAAAREIDALLREMGPAGDVAKACQPGASPQSGHTGGAAGQGPETGLIGGPSDK